MTFKFGKAPARPDAIRLKFGQVFRTSELPTPPAAFGHYVQMPDDNWGMLGNDSVGDCVFAGAAHEEMIFTLEGSLPRANFTTANALADYSAVTGFDPTKPDTDQGTDMQAAAAYRQKVGLLDSDGNRRKIDAYAAIAAGNLDQLARAAYIFGAAGVGVVCPSSMQRQFNANEPWDVVPGDTVDDGHYIPCVGRTEEGAFVFISWGRLQLATPDWVAKYMDEAVCYLSLEIINNSTKLSPESFNADALTQYLKDIA